MNNPYIIEQKNQEIIHSGVNKEIKRGGWHSKMGRGAGKTAMKVTKVMHMFICGPFFT